jgi:hypothetical protein
MVGHNAAPFRPVFLIFPFNNFLDGKFSLFRGSVFLVKVDNSKTAAPYIAYKISFIQSFMFRQFRNNTVKMDRFPVFTVRQGRMKVRNGLPAADTQGGGQWLGIELWRRPAGPFDKFAVFGIPGNRYGPGFFPNPSFGFVIAPGILSMPLTIPFLAGAAFLFEGSVPAAVITVLSAQQPPPWKNR